MPANKSKPPADPDISALAEQLHAGAIRLLRGVRAADAESGLSGPKLSALSVLVFAGPMSLGALAEAEQVRAPTMSKLVATLEAEGLVQKKADAEDRRALRIHATAKGKAVMLAGRARRLALIEARLARVTQAERARLKAAAIILLRLGSDKS